MNKPLFRHLDTLWNFMGMEHALEPSDCIFVLCSNDLRVAEYAASLFHKGLAPCVIFSGGEGRFTDGLFDKTEAETFAAIAVECGVPKDRIILENKATNTGENVRFTFEELTQKNLSPSSFILVQKPFMEKRTYATFKQQWPGNYSNVVVTSDWRNWVDYFNEDLPLDMVISALVADFERVRDYPEKGFQIEMAIPQEVYDSYEAVKKLNF